MPTRSLTFLLSVVVMLGAGESAIKGHYAGSWSGASGASGAFELSVAMAADKPKCEISFTYAGEKVKTTVTLCKTSASNIEAQYDFDVDGNRLQSTIHGELKDNALTGKYQTKALADGSAVDEGDWKAEPAH
jgi:hypothetical protein